MFGAPPSAPSAPSADDDEAVDEAIPSADRLFEWMRRNYRFGDTFWRKEDAKRIARMADIHPCYLKPLWWFWRNNVWPSALEQLRAKWRGGDEEEEEGEEVAEPAGPAIREDARREDRRVSLKGPLPLVR